MPVKQLNTLVQLLVCLIAIPSHMCAPREGSMKGLEEEGTAMDLRFKIALVFECEASLSFVTANQILLDFRFHRQLFICLCLLHVIGLFNYRFEDQSFLCYKVECV